jgi:hypothetical protein
MQDDWRLRIELPEVRGLVDRLRQGLSTDAEELAKELDDDSVFVYAASRRQAEQAQAILEAELADLKAKPRLVVIEHWLADEDRWDDQAPGPDVEEDVLARGYAPWEVRVECDSPGAARDLAEQLESEGYGVVKHWRFVLAGVATRAEADALAARLHGQVEPGGELVWEVTPSNPFAFLGGLAG